jgi:hypothetical protein
VPANEPQAPAASEAESRSTIAEAAFTPEPDPSVPESVATATEPSVSQPSATVTEPPVGAVRSTVTSTTAWPVLSAASVATAFSVQVPSAGTATAAVHGAPSASVATRLPPSPHPAVTQTKKSTFVTSVSGVDATTPYGSLSTAATYEPSAGALIEIVGAPLSTRRSSTRADAVALPAASIATARRS